jgi:hypothetical protein
VQGHSGGVLEVKRVARSMIAKLCEIARANASAIHALRNAVVVSTLAVFLCLGAEAPGQETWIFDRIDQIGGHPATVIGHPRVIDSPVGKAVEFNGIDDGLFLDVHPLAGAESYTWEAIFRPDGGNAEQRWFQLEENPASGSNDDNRMLFEIRVVNGRWCLDAFNKSGPVQKALLDRSRLHELGVWHHVAAVYDGINFRSYVDGVEDGAAQVHLTPQGAGKTSVGVRINKVYYFKGAVHEARFTRRALSPTEFLKVAQRP